jgi:hypothetical protein
MWPEVEFSIYWLEAEGRLVTNDGKWPTARAFRSAASFALLMSGALLIYSFWLGIIQTHGDVPFRWFRVTAYIAAVCLIASLVPPSARIWHESESIGTGTNGKANASRILFLAALLALLLSGALFFYGLPIGIPTELNLAWRWSEFFLLAAAACAVAAFVARR